MRSSTDMQFPGCPVIRSTGNNSSNSTTAGAEAGATVTVAALAAAAGAAMTKAVRIYSVTTFCQASAK